MSTETSKTDANTVTSKDILAKRKRRKLLPLSDSQLCSITPIEEDKCTAKESTSEKKSKKLKKKCPKRKLANVKTNINNKRNNNNENYNK